MKPSYTIETNLLQLISSQQAYHYRIIPIEAYNGTYVMKSDNPSPALRRELKVLLGKDIEILEETTENMQAYLSSNYRIEEQEQSTSLHFSDDFLATILKRAKAIGSSDIHFEPFEEFCRVRYRLDGKLKTQYEITIDEYPVIINKLKIQSGLDISEKRLPQDGRITLKYDQIEFDIRVSTLPTLYGEKIVLRILSKDTDHLNLSDLGFTQSELESYSESVKKPNGIILISGPTGSGKTTTLYATLKELNTETTNILTIEDPIEYTLEGINQVQLKESIGLDFSSTLRTFLRQDPDIIMVGEIRDEKTANMAIRAALTGHLVLSTIHTNSAWATISRLIDMGIPPFLIASTLNVSVAQRLVRKLCNSCKEEKPLTINDVPINFKIPSNFKSHYNAVGCTSCYHTGYQGRKAIYEILPITKDLIEYIKSNRLQIDEYLKSQNIATLRQNAIELVKEGITSIDEVYPLLTD